MAFYSLLAYGLLGFVRADDTSAPGAVVVRDSLGNTTSNVVTGNGGIVSGGKTELEVVTKTAAYTLAATETICLCDATSAAFTITLPAPAASTNRVYIVKKIDSSANAVTISQSASEKIDGANTKVLSSQYDVARMVTDGTNWYLL